MDSIISKSKSTLKRIEKADHDLKNKIIQFFLSNPNPVDSQIHDFADTLGISFDELENVIYKMFTSFIECLDSCRAKEEIVYSETAYTQNDEQIDDFIDNLYHTLKSIDVNVNFDAQHSTQLSVINFSGNIPNYLIPIDKALSYSKLPRGQVSTVRRGKIISVRIRH